MDKKILPVIAGVALVAVIGVGGYLGYRQYAVPKLTGTAAEQQVKESFAKLSEMKSFAFELKSLTTTKPTGLSKEAMKVDFAVEGKVATQETGTPHIQALVKLKAQPADSAETPMEAEFALRAVNNTAYFNLMKLVLPSAQALPIDINPYLNKWISLSTGASGTAKEALTSAEEKRQLEEIKTLFEKTNFFSVEQSPGSGRHVIRLDEQKTRDMLREILRISEAELGLKERGQLMEMVTELSKHDLTISLDNQGFLREILGKQDDAKMASTVAVYVSKINEPVQVEEPKADLTIEELLQKALGLPPGTKLQDLFAPKI